MRSFEDSRMDQWTTRQYWDYEDAMEALFDGWKASLKRQFAKEEADINNNEYRQLRSVSRHRYFEEAAR